MDTSMINENSINSDLVNNVIASGLQTHETSIKDLEVDTRVQGEGYYRLAKIFYDKSDLRQAEDNFLKALKVSDLPRDCFPVFKTYGFLIRIYSELQNAELAEVYIRKSEELVDLMATSFGSLNSEYFYNVGVTKTYRGLFTEARESFMITHKKAQEENEPEVLSKTLYSLAVGSFNLREFKEALNYLEQLTQLLQILKKEYLFGSMHLLSGNIYSELGLYQKSLDHYKLAAKALQRKNSWNLYGYILLGQGIVYKKMGEFDKALILFDLAQNSCDEQNFSRLSTIVNNEIADVNDSDVDIYLDKQNRIIHEKTLGTIDFKHRFVLLEILFLLAKNSGNYYNKEDLAKSIWKDEYNPLIHDKLIYTSISRLRKLIEPKDTATKRTYILRGKDGYTFNPSVKARFYKEQTAADQTSIGNVELNSPV